VLYRENGLNSSETKWLNGFHKLKSLKIPNLHAKCYLNENSAILTSMNFYEHSQINNHELGILIESIDKENFLHLLLEIESIINSEMRQLYFSKIVEKYSDYSMGRLAKELILEYLFPNNYSTFDSEYQFICNKARQLKNFNPNELYQDRSAVLRSTNLTKEEFDLLKIEISKSGKSKFR